MGYRQQFFVTAKINGKYRMLAVVHHQWIYGRTSLRQCLQILKIFSSDGNLPGFRRELAQAASTTPSVVPTTYPFISTALIIGSSFHEEGHYSANVKPQLLDTAWNTFPNDDGIVVFDITEPDKPRYGYVWLGAPMSHAQYASRLPLMNIMDAAKYISGYYDWQGIAENDVTGILMELKRFRLIDPAMLNELWPNGQFKSMSRLAEPWRDTEAVENERFSFDIIDRYLKGEDTKEDGLVAWVSPESYSSYAMDQFAKNPALLSTDRGWELLMSIVGKVSQVDLTPFPNIKMDKIMTIIKAAAATRKTITLWLSNHTEVELADLRTIVNTNVVSALHLGRTKKVKQKDMIKELFGGPTLEVFTTPLLFSRACQLTFGPDQEVAQAQLRISEDFPCGIGTRFPIRQIVYLTSTVKDDASRLDSGGLCWKHRKDNSYFAALYLKDALFTLRDLVELAPKALARLATVQEWQLESQPIAKVVLGIAKMMAIDESYGISPLPGIMYKTASSAHYDSSKGMMEMMPPSLGGWTLLALHERPSSNDGTATIRYAFISEKSDSPGSYNILEAQTFLSHFTQGDDLAALDSEWKQALSRLRNTMTTLKKAPETEAATMPELVARTGGGRDTMNPETCKDVKFEVCAHEEVVEALAAIDVLKDKPVNRFRDNMPAGMTCQQN